MNRLFPLALALWVVSALGQPKTDWEIEHERRNWTEGEFKLPPYPKPADLIEFYVSATTEFKFFVDRQSLSVGKDGVVRYTLLARSASGAENVTYEGMLCSEGSYRVYAYGRAPGAWTERDSDWRPIQKTMLRSHHALWRDYFCPHKVPIFDVAEGIDALRSGGHPNAGEPQIGPARRY